METFTNVDHLPSFTFELLRSLLGQRSESVVSSYSKRSEEGTEGNIFYASGFTLKGSCSYMRL
jgi:hypothetical protein